MLTPAQIASQLLEQDRRSIAESVLARLESQLDDQSGIQSRGSATWTSKIETHVQTLAACIHFASPLLIADYVCWGSISPDENPPFPNEVETVFRHIEEVARLEFPKEVGTVVSQYIETAFEARPCQESEAMLPQPSSDLQRKYLSALLAMNRAEALQLAMQAVHSDIGVGRFYLDVLQPTQREIGRLWQSGRISVAQEHYSTAATQFVMSQLQPYFLQKSPCHKTLVAACAGDELHEVGLRILSDIFAMEGWNTVYLGANVPGDSVAQTLIDCGANVLAVSATMTRHLFTLSKLIAAVRANPKCQNIRIMVGGYPFNVDPFLWHRVGADAGTSSVSEAIRIANSYSIEKDSQDPLDRTPPAVRSQLHSMSPTESESLDDLSRLNNELVTAQRQLNSTNLELRHLNEVNEQKTKQLEEADRRKDEFLAMLAHELRGPLGPMNYALAILEMENVDTTIIAEARETLKRQVQQMAHLINDLLDASRIAHGKIDLKRTRVSLSELVERAVEIALPLIREKSHDLNFEYSQTSIFLEGDEIRLIQVFANLLTNAAKYTEEGGAIWLSTELEGDQARIEVRDNGIGIEADLLPHIYGTFIQEQRSRTHSRGGLGLGLSLVKQLIDLHDGTVEAASEGAGKGCTFTVRLPALEPIVAEKLENDEAPGITVAVKPRRVLIVDDTACIAKITARLFQIMGHEPIIALDGKSAIQKFQELLPEIVVLDLILPDMSGFDVAQEIRTLDGNNQTLIVAQTGSSDGKNRQHAQEAGFDEYLVKPVGMTDLRKLATHPRLQEVNRVH